ncbi:hypothetical protein [Gymnodinialimonas hymeniacidonis]|uniref:hypothetical protein n=1 Tax=Gymnodinialimonas hymeniacidonis TaxID=3126508 RepID=UPI0034C5B9DB
MLLASLPAAAQIQPRTMTCAIDFVCTGVSLDPDTCERAEGAANVQITTDLITVSAFEETLRFDDITPGSLSLNTGMTASGLDTSSDPARYMTLVLSDTTLGVFISDERAESGEYYGARTFAATCPAP